MRTHLIAAGATLAAITALAVPVPTRAQNDPASRAVTWLRTQQLADGSLDHSPGETEDLVLGAAAAGFDPARLRPAGGASALDFLAASTTAGAATADAGKTGKLILAVLAAHREPGAFPAAGTDLWARLDAFRSASGRYGTGAAFPQALAVLALTGGHRPLPAGALDTLRRGQNPDGSWSFSPAGTVQGDTNDTAMALMALDAAGDHGADTAALAYLRTQQNADGGFPYQKPSAYGTGSDPDSGALVVEALAAAGQDPAGCGWAQGTHTALGSLQSELGAAGGATFPGNSGPDAFTTSQVPLGLTAQPLPVRSGFGAGSGPAEQAHAGLGALGFLVAGMGSDGAVAAAVSPTEDLVLGAAAAGVDPATLRHGGAGPLDYLAANVATATATAGRAGRLLLTLGAARIDPHGFAGHDVLATLQATFAAGSGRYGDGSTFTQSLAILGLAAVGQPVSQAAVARLASLQDTDGSWNFTAAPDASVGGDSNSTAIALMALDAAGDHAHDGSGLAALRAFQATDGGFRYAPTLSPDPDSTALGIQAIEATGGSPAAWLQGTATPLTWLLAAQDRATGGYTFPGAPGPDAFTTSQVPVALERVAFPVVAAWAAGHTLDAAPASVAATPVTTCAASPGGPPTSQPSPGATPGGAVLGTTAAGSVPVPQTGAAPPSRAGLLVVMAGAVLVLGGATRRRRRGRAS